MNNIFKNAYFGKPYKTRNGDKALYHRYDSLSNRHCLTHDGFSNDIKHISDGVCSLEYKFQTSKGNAYFKHDIISEWQDDDELDKLAETYNPYDKSNACDLYNSFNEGFIEGYGSGFFRGYRKAKESE